MMINEESFCNQIRKKKTVFIDTLRTSNYSIQKNKQRMKVISFHPPRKITHIATILLEAGAEDILIVGGGVRDHLLGRPLIDYDIEVYGLSYEKIAQSLAPYFKVNFVGKSFGILKVGNNIDIALPRTESKVGSGHTGFNVVPNPQLSPKEAFARRDFTINAIGMRLDGTIVDYYGGEQDLRKKILRATSPAFKDDPLRVLRGMQFASRFGMTTEETTIRYCRELLPEFSTLSAERIFEEWHKWAIRGKYPSLGLELLHQTGWITPFQELSSLVGCPQNPQWHPEGDVWEHTKLVTNQMANYIQEEENKENSLSDEEKTVLMFAALCHDFGKPVTTTCNPDGTIRSLGHASAGEPLARSFLMKMKTPLRIMEQVLPLVREHMAILNTQKLGEPSPRTLRRLSARLAPATVKQWCAVCQTDALGCFPPACNTKTIRFQADVWLRAAREAQVENQKPKPILLGRHLLENGLTPGPEMGIILKEAYEAQLDGLFGNLEEAIIWWKNRGFF